MGANENLALHRVWADAENDHDISHHEDFLHPDIEVNLPGGERVLGVDGYRAMMASMYAGLPDFHTDIDDRFATEDRVVCRWRSTGTHQGEYSGFPPTGKRLTFAGMSLWEFEDGKARRGWAFPDVAAVVAQLMS
jgi:steroid delta-isomerase-like uncharacterized protein